MRQPLLWVAPILLLAGFLAFPVIAYGASYRVQSGDWLSSIAPTVGTSWQSLCSFNHLTDCDQIYVDQVLQIPDGSDGVAPVTPPATLAAAGVPGLSTVLASAYVYGGSFPPALDCSGLTSWLATQRGLAIPRSSQGQISGLRHIDLAEALPGDIIAFNWGHVGTYLGGGKVVQALNPSQGVRITTLLDGMTYNGFLTALAVGH